jgi:arylsulfatase A-like enzyme
MTGDSPNKSRLRKLLSSLPETTAGDLLLFGIWTGIICGVAEAARAVWRQQRSHLPTGEFLTAEVFWMTPLPAMATFIATGVVLIAIDRLMRGQGGLLGLGPPVFAALGGYSFLRAMQVGLANWATWLLALGFATVVVRVIAAKPILIRRLVRATTPLMVAALVAWAGAVPLWRTASVARVRAALPEPRPEAPNVLVIIWDAVRALNLSAYGYARETTPELERFAERGAVFERAFATAPWSLPSHASIYTGHYPTELSTARQAPLDATYPTLAEVLARNGYATGGFTANRFYGSTAFGNARGFDWYDARPGVNAEVIASRWWLTARILWEVRVAVGNEYAPSALGRSAAHVNRSLLRWIDGRGERPFFALINHFDAHDPYYPPEPFSRAFSETRGRYWLDEPHRAYSEDMLRELRDAYDSSILYLDHELARLLHALRERGLLDNTLIILTSDHGEEFGEHGLDVVAHAKSLYAPVLHVPLIVVYPPRVPAAVRRREPVSIRDIPATVMDVLGLATESPFPGTSLLRYANGTVTVEEIAEPRLSVAEHSPMGGILPTWPIAAGNMFSLVQGDLHYILDGAGREQLFDLSTDIWEQHDLAGSPDAALALARFRDALDSLVTPEHGVRRVYVARDKRGMD